MFELVGIVFVVLGGLSICAVALFSPNLLTNHLVHSIGLHKVAPKLFPPLKPRIIKKVITTRK